MGYYLWWLSQSQSCTYINLSTYLYQTTWFSVVSVTSVAHEKYLQLKIINFRISQVWNTLLPGLGKMHIFWEEVYISNTFPTVLLFLYVKSHNFPGRSFPEVLLFNKRSSSSVLTNCSDMLVLEVFSHIDCFTMRESVTGSIYLQF